MGSSRTAVAAGLRYRSILRSKARQDLLSGYATVRKRIDELLMRHEPRKILHTVVDGQPAQLALCQQIVRRCWDGGIEACGLGIGMPDIQELFLISHSIMTLAELAAAVLGVL